MLEQHEPCGPPDQRSRSQYLTPIKIGQAMTSAVACLWDLLRWARAIK